MGTGLRYSPLSWLTATKRFILKVSGMPDTDFMVSDMEAGYGITSGVGTICEHSVTKVGGIFKTEILIDLTGLNGCGAADDIIGKDGDAIDCHIGRITATVNGTIIAGLIECHEAPAGGNTDIDLYSAVESTGVQDAAIGTNITETQLCNAGAHSAGSTDVLTAWPAADEYLYLVAGANTDADFSAGRLLITLWGV